MGFVGLFQLAVKCFEVLAWPLLALGYPLCASIQAIETNSNSDTVKLITYWVSLYLIFLFECAFEKLLEWFTFWPYIKLMIVGRLVVPDFDGSLYVYKHLVHPCLAMDSRIVVSQFNKLKELLFKKDDFLIEVERYVKENGPDALENLIAFKKKSAEPDVAVKEMNALAAEDLPKCEEPKLPHKESNDVEITEQKEAVTTKQVRKIESNVAQAVNRPFAPLEIKETATAAVTRRDILEIPPSKKLQKQLTCAICEVTTQRETDLNSHLQGNCHKTACGQVKAKKQMLRIEVSHASVGKKPNIPTETAGVGVKIHTSKNVPKAWTCVVCGVEVKSKIDIDSHFQGKRHKEAVELLKAKNQASTSKVSVSQVGKESHVTEAKKEGEQENLLKSQVVEIGNGKWWCAICNISCTRKRDVDSHLRGKKHLAKMRELNNVGGSGHV